jgi:hypothetical protein
MATQGTASPQSVGSDTAEYDPRTDPKRKAKSSDPGWKYGFWPEIGNRDLVECSLCGGRLNSGIKRLKEHLVGGYGDAVKCPKTTTAIAAEMEAALLKGRRKRALNLDDDDDGVQVVEVVPTENQVQNIANASSLSSGMVQHPSSGTASKKKQSALKFASLPPRPEEKSVIPCFGKNLKKWLRKGILRMDLHKAVWREGSGPRKKEMKSTCMWPISSMSVEYHSMLSTQGALRLCVRPLDSMDLDINLLASMR